MMNSTQFSMDYIDQLLKSKSEVIDQAIQNKVVMELASNQERKSQASKNLSLIIRKVQKYRQISEGQTKKDFEKMFKSCRR